MKTFISYLAAAILLFSVGLFTPSYSLTGDTAKPGTQAVQDDCSHLKQEIARLNNFIEAKHKILRGLRNRRVYLHSLKKKNCSYTDFVCQIYNSKIDEKILAIERQIASIENLISIIRNRLTTIHKQLTLCIQKDPIIVKPQKIIKRPHKITFPVPRPINIPWRDGLNEVIDR